MKRNGKNIITDQDITLTGQGHSGQTLETALTDHDVRLDRVESNVKWMYRNGRVGAGAGGGSGSGTSTGWSAVVTRLDTGEILKDGTSLSLAGAGSYMIGIQVYKGGSDSFSVRWTYQASRGTISYSDELNSNNSFYAQRTLNLDINGTLTIRISNRSEPDEAPITYTIPYVTSPYSFSLSYVYADTKDPFTLNTNNTIFMSSVKTRGIMAALNYSVAVGIQSASYTYRDWKGTTRTVSDGDDAIKERTSGTIYLDLCPDIIDYLSNDDNAKFHQFLVDIDLVLADKIDKENIPQLALKDNLVPSSIYLRVTASGGTIYDSSQSVYPESGQFIVGTVVFQVTPFYGAIVVGRTYNFTVFLDDVQLGEDEGIRITTLTDQTLQSIPIPIATAMEHKVTFSILEPVSGASYTVDYWLTAREATSSFTYYPRRTTGTGTVEVTPVTSDVYRKLEVANNIEGLTPLSTITSSAVSTQPVTYNFLSQQLSTYDNLDQMICLGIQYVRTNDTSVPIAKIGIVGGPQGEIYIYQNKILIRTDAIETGSLTGSECEIYLPMCKTLSDADLENYHLITIYKRLENHDGNNWWKGVYVYIDGVLEGAFGAFVASPHNKYSSISLYPGNYYVNLIESSSFVHSGDDPYESYLYDIDVQGYYYAYKELVLGQRVPEVTKQLYDNFRTFKADEENFILTDQTAIYNIAQYSEAPVLLINFTDQGNGINGIKGAGKDCFKEYMSTSYKESDEPERANVTIEYSSGLQEPVLIQKNGMPAVFSIEPQGSSTKSFRCKNWEMYAPSPIDEDHICVYSPNFSSSDTKTFLPEESFTLKADIVDSSHTNNNAVGDFVNDVTTPFSAALNAQKTPTGERSKYATYIKNCLTGFACLVFLHTNFKSDEAASELSEHRYYFLGVYNFNLGRKSYFNLGYKNTAVLENITLQEGFGIYDVPRSNATLLNGIMVGEVQGNNEYFDFSQYDNSILFKKDEGNDTTYMWGDFVNGSGSEAVTKTAISRFVEKVSKAGGYIFDSIKKNYSVDGSDNIKYGYMQGYSAVDDEGVPRNQVPNYRAHAVRTVIGAENVYDFSLSSEDATRNDLVDFIMTNEEDPTKIKGIDYASLCEYYTTCMAFGMVDSVEKNLNIKSWTNGDEFYLAFYDMDTCLGVSNSGSKISYFAFSDYWDWENSIVDGNFESVKIYRDYAPKGEGGAVGADSFYDVPSSYLFAIAKYAYFVLLASSTSSDQVSEISNHPNNIWARWRRGDGCLGSAEKFISKYYRNHLASIPEVALNYNYRYKYFVRSAGNGFDTINFPKFYGRKIAYTETWLDNRLHILDAYFNINSINDLLTARISAPMVTNETVVDKNNKDIYVLHDVFSDNNVGAQYANVSSSVTAKAKPFAPLIIVTPNVTSRYMFPDDEERACGFNVRTSGNQTVLFGGSALWTEISSINPFITQANAFSITSDYFTNITGTGGATCGQWTFNTPSLKSLSLTNNDERTFYTGNISFEGVENYPNLSSVRIDGTGIQLNISNSNISSISALRMKTGARLNVTNTPNISDIKVSGEVGNLSLPGWGTNIAIPYSGEINSTSIQVHNTKYPRASITISNAPLLETLNLTGFSKVVIFGCPKLKTITLGEVEDQENYGLRTIDITMPLLSADDEEIESFVLGGDPNIVDLTSWEYLESVRLSNLYMITEVKLPDTPEGQYIDFLPGAFSGCTKLQYISGTGKRRILSSDNDSSSGGVDSNTFYNAPNFTMRQYEDGPLIELVVSENNTNLNGTFFINSTLLRGKIGYEEAKYFLQTSCATAGNVRSCTNLFRNQIVTYNRDLFVQEYNRGECSLALTNLSGCNEVRYVFRGCPFDAINRYMFAGMDNLTSFRIPVSEDSWYAMSRDNNENMEPIISEESGAIVSTNRVIYATYDSFYEIIDKLKTLEMLDSSQGLRLCIIEPTSNPEQPYTVVDTLNVADLFNPIDKCPEQLIDLEYVEFFEGHKLNLQGTFTSSWGVSQPGTPGLRIMYFMYYGYYRYFASDTALEGLFKDTKLASASFCFRELYNYPGSVDIENFINWGPALRFCSNLFFSSSGSYSLGFKKHCSYSGFHNIWYNILTYFDFSKGGSNGGIGSIFNDCSIIEPNSIPAFTLVDEESYPNLVSNATNISYLFTGLNHRRSLNDETKLGLHITSDFLKPLPKITIARQTFNNTIWANPIPFNFFRKQTDPTTQTVYVDKDGERIEATMTTFSYRKELTDITGCFSGVKLEENICYDPNASYNTGVTRKTIIDEEENEYTRYYLTQDSEEEFELEDPGYTDCFGFTVGIPSETINYGADEWTNPAPSGSLRNGVFCAPDIFYGVAVGGTIEDAFNVSSFNVSTPVFTGAIPKHLVKDLSTSTSLSGVLSGLNIWPIKYAEKVDSDGLTHVYYYFVPEDFTNRSNLARSFNFKLIIPEKTERIQGGAIRPHYYILLNTSIPDNTNSLDSAFPYGSDIKREWAGDDENIGSFYTIMGNPILDETTGDFVDMETGIDHDKFYNLKYDNIILPGLAAIMSGDFIRGGRGVLTWNKKTYIASRGNVAIIIGINGLSTNAKIEFPPMNDDFLTATSNSTVSKSSVLNWDELEATIDTQIGRPKYYPNINFVD